MAENRPRDARRAFRRLVKSKLADVQTVEKDDMTLLKYEKDGEFDYELYKEIQELGNKLKLSNQWVPEVHIQKLSDYANSTDIDVKTGICHGTRRGNEQAWFHKHLKGSAEVIGTEISETAADFPDTIQWDFHAIKEEWVGSTDLIYSNSWDHSYDPKLAFRTWASCLAPKGVMFLDHGWNYEPGRVNVLDPFGISEDGLVSMLNKECAQFGQVVDVIDGGASKKNLPIRTIIFRAN